MENLHLEILDDERRFVFGKLPAFREFGYLAGGTALALQVGHRISYDFDIFCHEEIRRNFPERANKEMIVKKVLVNSRDEFTFLTEHEIKISFIHYPFELGERVVEDDQWPLPLLSPLGVAVTKAYALSRRSAWRDYLDIYWVVNHGLASLEEIIRVSQKTYGGLFNEKIFLGQLVYTDDIASGEIMETQLVGRKVALAEVKKYFEQLVADHWRKQSRR